MPLYDQFAIVYQRGPYLQFSKGLAESVLPEYLDDLGIKGKELLDVACGEGSFAVTMAKGGYQVTGIDLQAGQHVDIPPCYHRKDAQKGERDAQRLYRPGPVTQEDPRQQGDEDWNGGVDQRNVSSRCAGCGKVQQRVEGGDTEGRQGEH